MAFLRNPSSFFCFGIVLLTSLQTTFASPAHNPVLRLEDSLVERQNCQNPCGYDGWLCCAAGQVCFTNPANAQAGCTGGALPTPAVQQGNGYWAYFTSTWVVTNVAAQTYTSVYSSFVPAAPTAAAVPTVPAGGCTNPCNQVCCGEGSYCLIWDNSQCANAVTTNGVAPVPAPTPPTRPTSSGVVTATVPFESAVPTGVQAEPVESGGGGLSGGAIAGIVIGVLAGILLLLLLCLFCCARALFDSILAIFGLGKKKKRTHVHEETYIEQSGHGRRWYGADRPSKPEKKKSKLGGLGGVAGILGALTLALGLKRRHDRKHDDKSSYTSSGYYSSDYTSSSSSSSDRRTRQTRHSSRH